MSRKALQLIPLLVIVALVVAMLPTSAPAALAQDKTKIVWFVGLGTGGQPEQLDVEYAVVDAFNASQDAIELEIIIADNNVAPDTLSTLIASGEAPDIIGPVGTTGANRFGDNWLHLGPLVEAADYDLSQFPAASVDNFRVGDALVGLPFATFPSFLWYRPGLFEEAGLELPPMAYGEPYMLDGEEVPWNWDTIRTIGMLLTVDANGYDATEPEFDADNTIQWGFALQWSDPRGWPTHFGAGSIYNFETGEAQMPEQWRAFYHWWYDGVWTDQFIPNAAEEGSDLLGAGNAFQSGNLAMAATHLWYTCCIDDSEWDAAPMPANAEGVVTAKMHGDTFRVFAGTEHPEEAFEVLTYLVGEASLDLLAVYGGLPARVEDQPAYFDFLNEKYTQGVNWDVVMASSAYADSPSHEAWYPNFNKGEDVLQNFDTLIQGTPGLDIDAELDQLVADMQAVFDEVE